jgi:hypothetical protein
VDLGRFEGHRSGHIAEMRNSRVSVEHEELLLPFAMRGNIG